MVSLPSSMRLGPPTPQNTPRYPVRKHIRPVRMLYREGVQTVEALWASVNRIPCLARASTLAVVTLASGL